MIATRSIGLDCGPMIGFNHETLDKEFFPDGKLNPSFFAVLDMAILKKSFQEVHA